MRWSLMERGMNQPAAGSLMGQNGNANSRRRLLGCRTSTGFRSWTAIVEVNRKQRPAEVGLWRALQKTMTVGSVLHWRLTSKATSELQHIFALRFGGILC